MSRIMSYIAHTLWLWALYEESKLRKFFAWFPMVLLDTTPTTLMGFES